MRTLLLLICCAFSTMLAAQTCLSDSPETTPTSDFSNNGNGTITDNTTGLMWMQCSLGQTWFNGNCQGDADALNWQQALQQAHGFEFADLDGWRLPNVKELATLTERRCVRPAINEVLFPNTPSDDFWTSTPSLSDAQRAWVVAFFNSSNSIKQKNLFVFVRLVRTAD
ncbi:DUF1566 domain-containing protein [Aliiglaciecola sp. LCG003]|uniref:Lcl C-terminal domain-containing protein n=1 Tax=Aliiglaciecola sp. LCG003 TaxID=3053655 RepID=UPI0025733FE6|nr:DUF1566 domain-containing protein [Aliiglaciecola sp. LCG003]WJG10376.1 DUF1566 domain-containing protein [Aliiglaciecola sp. LCG003]